LNVGICSAPVFRLTLRCWIKLFNVILMLIAYS
jgi:hypothetical protein